MWHAYSSALTWLYPIKTEHRDAADFQHADCANLRTEPLSDADEPSSPFNGEWRTTIGVVTLEQNGESVTGSYGQEDGLASKAQ